MVSEKEVLEVVIMVQEFLVIEGETQILENGDLWMWLWNDGVGDICGVELRKHTIAIYGNREMAGKDCYPKTSREPVLCVLVFASFGHMKL